MALEGTRNFLARRRVGTAATVFALAAMGDLLVFEGNGGAAVLNVAGRAEPYYRTAGGYAHDGAVKLINYFESNKPSPPQAALK